jgi:PAS domain S-box-containing protein
MVHVTQPDPVTGELASSRGQRPSSWLLWPTVGGIAMVVSVAAFVSSTNQEATAQAVGDSCNLLAVIVAAVSCVWAAYKATEERPAWTMLALAVITWAIGQGIWTTYGFTRDHVYPFPSVADLAFTGYAVPAIAGLFLFPRVKQRLSSSLRTLLDGLVIALGVVFVSWATVLGSVFDAGGSSWLPRLTGLAYPVADALVVSLVLVLGMRRPAGQRMPWLLLGGGLTVLAVTDSIYVFLVNAGHTGLTGTPLTIGWMSAWLLVALSPWVTRAPASAVVRREVALLIELVPYVPVLCAVVVTATGALSDDGFLLSTGSVLLAAVVARQVMIVYENVTLTRDLENKVALRTTELAGLGSIVQSSSDAIIATSVSGSIKIWNPGAERLFGYSRDQIVGRHIGVLMPVAPVEAQETSLAAVVDQVLLGQQLTNYQAEWLRDDGSLVPVAFTFSPIWDGDVIQGISAIGQDVSEQRAAQVDLELARSQALESSRLKSQFLATMSHEIRTPMNGVIGLTDLLLDTPLNEMQRQYAEGVQEAGGSLLDLINDILDFSKLEAGKVELDVNDFEPRRLVEEVAALLAPTAHSKHLELVAYCLPEIPATLVGDGGRVRQILLNLASNAVKFTEAGEVAITVRPVRDDAGQELTRFEVVDTGIGISAEARTQLFESFSQADASTTRRYGGTGLGLAISRHLTDAMGGEIGVDSQVGLGSTFWFHLPLPAGRSMVSPASVTPELLAGLPVLVVDDNATNRLVLKSQLTAWGLNPDVVDDPHAVLALMRGAAAAGTPYAIAVLDMCMPDMDGLELARMISSDQTLSDTRLIMLTSSMQVDAAVLRQGGVHDCLTKPVRSSMFYDRLMRLMAPAAAETVALLHSQPVQPVDSASRGRVLVVEDNALNQLVAEGVVSKLGYQVDLVANGVEAVNAVSASSYSAVLMDCHMPVMDGFEATGEIRRRQGSSARTPIIAMTAGAMAEDRERCLAAGMDDFVAKPVSVAAVGQALARWVRDEPTATAVPVQGAQGDQEGNSSIIDAQRQAVLRSLGPDDGWGILPAAVRAFLHDCPSIVAAMRTAIETSDAHGFGESAHQLKGAAANIGAVKVAALCDRAEASTSDEVLPDRELLDQLEAALDRTTPVLRNALPGPR